MRLLRRVRSISKQSGQGFTLTEMLVTLLIMTLASTLMATGIPVAVDTYQKTVNSANAQMALSTTLTVLRGEFGTSTEIKQVGDTVYYRSDESVFAAIEVPEEDEGYRGLVKHYYVSKGTDENQVFEPFRENGEALGYPLVSNAAITEPLRVKFDSIVREDDEEDGEIVELVVTNLCVFDEATPQKPLVQLDEYRIAVPFAK